MPVESAGDVSTFNINELTGEERTVRLTGRGLPYRPYELSAAQRVKTKFYPGNPVGIATVLGAEEQSTTLRGAWKDKFIGVGAGDSTPITISGEAIRNTRTAVAAMESIVREGQEVEVTWDEQVRRGYFVEFRHMWDTVNDVAWEMSFTWISRGEAVGAAVFTQEGNLTDTSSIVQRQTNALLRRVDPPFQIAAVFQEKLAALVNPIVESASVFVRTVTNLASQSIAPQEAIRSGVSICNGLLEQTNALRAELESEIPATRNLLTPIVDQTFGDRLSATVWSRRLIGASVDLRRTAAIRRVTLAKSIQALLLGTYVVREGDDLRNISRIFYGTPHEWRRLLRFNQTSSSLVTPGTLILVPRTDIGDRRA